MKLDQRLKKSYIDIHRAIHGKLATVKVGNIRLLVKEVARLRSVSYDSFTFMEQNPNKSSVYAKAARDGKHITWGIFDGPWLYIDDEIAAEFDNQQKIRDEKIRTFVAGAGPA